MNINESELAALNHEEMLESYAEAGVHKLCMLAMRDQISLCWAAVAARPEMLIESISDEEVRLIAISAISPQTSNWELRTALDSVVHASMYDTVNSSLGQAWVKHQRQKEPTMSLAEYRFDCGMEPRG